MVVSHGSKLVMMWGEVPPIYSIGFKPEGGEHDSGYSVLFTDAPDPDELEPAVDRLPDGISVMCLHCLVDEHPEIGKDLDLAREFGAADLDAGVWAGRRLEALAD
jgi:hypothetical protein